jgi:hypothetical protein
MIGLLLEPLRRCPWEHARELRSKNEFITAFEMTKAPRGMHTEGLSVVLCFVSSAQEGKWCFVFCSEMLKES